MDAAAWATLIASLAALGGTGVALYRALKVEQRQSQADAASTWEQVAARAGSRELNMAERIERLEVENTALQAEVRVLKDQLHLLTQWTRDLCKQVVSLGGQAAAPPAGLTLDVMEVRE